MRKGGLYNSIQHSPKAQKAIFLIFNVLITPIFILGLLLSFMNIRFASLNDRRIGHLVADTLGFLKIVEKKGQKHILIASDKPCNEQLQSMFRRRLKIVRLPHRIRHNMLFRFLHNKNSILNKAGFFVNVPGHSYNYWATDNKKQYLKFSKEDKEKGEGLLKEMGVKGEYICFHSRDPAYLKKKSRKSFAHHDIRDCSIKNYIKAVNKLSKEGLYAVRMGEVVAEKLPKTNKKVIDYAKNFRSDFGDIYLPGNAKFFLGCTAGLHLVSTLFCKPIAMANVSPLVTPPMRSGELFIPKKVWHKKEKRFLKFREIMEIDSSGKGLYFSDKYKNANVEVIENTPEEILDLADEMNQRIDGTWKTTKKDEELQKRFKALFTKDILCYGFPSRIGAKFLRENADLI